jgi:hypothetical protein
MQRLAIKGAAEMKLTAVALPDSRQTFRADGDEPARLIEHHFRDGRRNFLPKETETFAVLLLAVRPGRKFGRCGCVTDISGTAAHDKSQHDFRVAVSCVAQIRHH